MGRIVYPPGAGGGAGGAWFDFLQPTSPIPLAGDFTVKGTELAPVLEDTADGLLVTVPRSAGSLLWLEQPIPAPGPGGWEAEMTWHFALPVAHAGMARGVGLSFTDGTTAFSLARNAAWMVNAAKHTMSTGAYGGNGGHGSISGVTPAHAGIRIRETVILGVTRQNCEVWNGVDGWIPYVDTTMVVPPWGLGVAATHVAMYFVGTYDASQIDQQVLVKTFAARAIP